ncbi:zinc-binding protein A33-like [Pristis pectinata]|uniref:zinc-binding protein A33-like n=1 Tax=Pristis pectinata TaxID=685728 RepID=UPI00223CA05F|nr:zinc-binding protein A33-like [Pristis pectinata]
MEQGQKISWLEDELSCPICQDIFKDPVFPPCQHNFCCACLMSYWKQKGGCECPVCRETYSNSELKWNRTLANIVDSFLKEVTKAREQGEAGGMCGQHKEILKLFCKEDEEVLCVVCLHSKRHENHKCLPLDEAAKECKDELKILIKTLKAKMEKFLGIRNEYDLTLNHIQSQASRTEKQIKQEFQKLHCFLQTEEAILLDNLRREEEKQVQSMQQKVKRISEEISALKAGIQAIESQLSQKDSALFLLNLPANRKRAECTLPDPPPVSAMINVGRYVGSLQYRIWKKMLSIINTAPVTLDPNTAAPWLHLSEDLTTMGYCLSKQRLPDNPERFDSCISVLGSEGFTSGRHHWDVDVKGQAGWCLGVAKESVRRKGVIKVDPENGFWAIGLMDGSEYYACTSPWRTELSISPQVIRVYLDYKGGKVSFYNLENMSLLYTFTDTFTEKLFPYFCPCLVPDTTNLSAMKICPLKVALQN